jgi:LPXTG-site transpeptidase (sortase) family protein
MNRLQIEALGAFAGAVVFVVLAALVAILGAPHSIAVQAARVVATPRPTPAAKPAVAVLPKVVYSYPQADECPQMNNPGGGLAWIPSGNAGPWSTDGTVSIPALGTSAPVVRVGVDRRAQMVIPPGAGQVAWLDQGGIPGRTNNMVIAGHISWSGVPGAFQRIGNMRTGDLVYFTINGKRMTFRVVWACSFIRTTPLATRIMGFTNVPSVTLITCGGSWNSYAGTHNERIAVRAELVDTQPA